jgi:hypothetical protein
MKEVLAHEPSEELLLAALVVASALYGRREINRGNLSPYSKTTSRLPDTRPL